MFAGLYLCFSVAITVVTVAAVTVVSNALKHTTRHQPFNHCSTHGFVERSHTLNNARTLDTFAQKRGSCLGEAASLEAVLCSPYARKPGAFTLVQSMLKALYSPLPKCRRLLWWESSLLRRNLTCICSVKMCGYCMFETQTYRESITAYPFNRQTTHFELRTFRKKCANHIYSLTKNQLVMGLHGHFLCTFVHIGEKSDRLKMSCLAIEGIYRPRTCSINLKEILDF